MSKQTGPGWERGQDVWWDEEEGECGTSDRTIKNIKHSLPRGRTQAHLPSGTQP